MSHLVYEIREGRNKHSLGDFCSVRVKEVSRPGDVPEVEELHRLLRSNGSCWHRGSWNRLDGLAQWSRSDVFLRILPLSIICETSV